MNNIKSVLKNKGNIAIIGPSRAGKTVTLKTMVLELASINKKTLILENKGDFRLLTEELNGEYFAYDNTKKPNYDRLTTTICSSDILSENDILKIVREAEDKGIEVIVIDDGHTYLHELENLVQNIHIQLILSSQINTCNIDDLLNFKKIFDALLFTKIDSVEKSKTIMAFYGSEVIDSELKKMINFLFN